MRHALIGCFVPWEILAAVLVHGAHPFAAGLLTGVAVISIMSLTEVYCAETQNPKR